MNWPWLLKWTNESQKTGYIHSKWWNESLLTWMLRISSSKNKNEIKDNSIQTKTIYYQQTLIKGPSKRCSLKKRHYCLFYFSTSILDTESRLWLQVVWVRVHSLNYWTIQAGSQCKKNYYGNIPYTYQYLNKYYLNNF